jgi:predicted house-cleaning NTP pyrophosphatase (Maf/HAM1 superfamily)
MIHAGIIQINGRGKMAIEEVFGDNRRCAGLDIKKLSERCRFTHRGAR